VLEASSLLSHRFRNTNLRGNGNQKGRVELYRPRRSCNLGRILADGELLDPACSLSARCLASRKTGDCATAQNHSDPGRASPSFTLVDAEYTRGGTARAQLPPRRPGTLSKAALSLELPPDLSNLPIGSYSLDGGRHPHRRAITSRLRPCLRARDFCCRIEWKLPLREPHMHPPANLDRSRR
jgi:hypothetical protein